MLVAVTDHAAERFRQRVGALERSPIVGLEHLLFAG